MRCPAVYTPTEIRRWCSWRHAPNKSGTGYIPARPLVYMKTGLSRFKIAWLVLIGKLDALDWEN